MVFPGNHTRIELFPKHCDGVPCLSRPADKTNKLAFDVEVLGDRPPILSKNNQFHNLWSFFLRLPKLQASWYKLVYTDLQFRPKRNTKTIWGAHNAPTASHRILKPCAGCINALSLLLTLAFNLYSLSAFSKMGYHSPNGVLLLPPFQNRSSIYHVLACRLLSQNGGPTSAMEFRVLQNSSYFIPWKSWVSLPTELKGLSVPAMCSSVLPHWVTAKFSKIRYTGADTLCMTLSRWNCFKTLPNRWHVLPSFGQHMCDNFQLMLRSRVSILEVCAMTSTHLADSI